MGRKSRTKRTRKLIEQKLKSAGLEDKIVFVVAKDIQVRVPAIDPATKMPKRDEAGQIVTYQDRYLRYSARNPFRNLTKKLMRESPAVIREFLGTPNK